MEKVCIVDRPAFAVIGKKTWIGGPDNAQFGQFWEQCRVNGLLELLQQIRQQGGQTAGPQTGGAVLGISRVEKDPANRAFDYMIAIEAPAVHANSEGLERYQVPAARWAVFECHGPIPDALVASEIAAFSRWLPSSGYQHALAPEMEVYPARDDPNYCEFWLPVQEK